MDGLGFQKLFIPEGVHEEYVECDYTSNQQFSTEIGNMMQRIKESQSICNHKFIQSSETIESDIRELINKSDEQEFIVFTSKMAQRLYRIERGDARLKKGALLTAHRFIGTDGYIIMTKVDYESYFQLESNNTFEANGVPKKNKIIKSVFIEYSENGIESIKCSDANKSLATYWSETFIGLEKVHTSVENTKNTIEYFKNESEKLIRAAYNKIDIKQNSLIDTTVLLIKNEITRYFKTNTVFDINTFIGAVFRDYSFFNTQGVNILDIGHTIKDDFMTNHVNRKKCDSLFEIDAKTAKNIKFLTTTKINDDISIQFDPTSSGELNESIRNVIFQGEDYLMIKNTLKENIFNWDGDKPIELIESEVN